jgi:RNA polymerase sigma factor (TIGR02999 family)
MDEDLRGEVTRLLGAAGADESAWEALLPLLYQELQALARRQMGREREGHTLQATALVHEAWLRLAGDRDMEWSSRRHFFGAAARAMQRVLVDHARAVQAAKRGGGRARMTITLEGLEQESEPERVLAVNDALEALEAEDPRAAEVARLRFYAGLEVLEVARALEISERTVMREWAWARARLAELLGDREGSAPDEA